MSFENLIEDLKFLARINKGYKPNFSDRSFTSVSEWFPKLKRRWKGEQGEKGVEYIRTLINNITQINDPEIKEYIPSAIIGINNLAYTYKIDEQDEVSNDYAELAKNLQSIYDQFNGKKFFNYRPKIKTI